MHPAIRPRPSPEFSLGNQSHQSRFHIGSGMLNILPQEPPLNDPPQCILRRWILCQIIQNLRFNWRFIIQCQLNLDGTT